LVHFSVCTTKETERIAHHQLTGDYKVTRSEVFTALTLALAAAPALAVPEIAKDVVNFVVPPAAAAVPEPGLVPLLAMGVAAGIFLHWRSRRKKK
jgi:hypothetical protein